MEPSASTRRWWLGLKVVGVVFLCLFVALVTSLIRASRADGRETAAIRRRVLDTDHPALAAAFRELVSRRGYYRADPSVFGGDPVSVKRDHPDPRDPDLPVAIRELRPSRIWLDDKSATVMLATWSVRFFVVYLSSGADTTYIRSFRSSRELAPSLWYYEVEEK
jgi:hypothetical protein